jgi:imidazole glycerol-phosphate synthase subunit HisH
MVHLALLDYGAGNLHSLVKGLEAGGAHVEVTRDWDVALGRDALVLPGVGSFGAAVQALAGEEARIREALAAGLPCLGICLGMQLLLEGSDEGPGAGIGLVPGRVTRLDAAIVPQMGWNDVEPTRPDEPLFRGVAEPSFTAYYANSFICSPDDLSVVIATSRYEEVTLPAALRVAQTWGVQFHPEKSSAPGLRLLRNFIDGVRNPTAAGPHGPEPTPAGAPAPAPAPKAHTPD